MWGACIDTLSSCMNKAPIGDSLDLRVVLPVRPIKRVKARWRRTESTNLPTHSNAPGCGCWLLSWTRVLVQFHTDTSYLPTVYWAPTMRNDLYKHHTIEPSWKPTEVVLAPFTPWGIGTQRDYMPNSCHRAREWQNQDMNLMPHGFSAVPFCHLLAWETI